MKKCSKKHGFTIVELVIVIAVIAILAAVLIPTFSGIVEKANRSKLKQEAKNAYTQYVIDNAGSGSVPKYMLYKDEELYITIENGGVREGVYSSQEDALKALVGDTKVGDYNVTAVADTKLYTVIPKANATNFANSDIYITLSGTIGENEESLAFNLFYEDLPIGTVAVPEAAIADKTLPVTVTLAAIDPANTITVDEHTRAWAYDIDVSNLKGNLSEEEKISVKLSTPNALPAVQVYHSGNEIDVDYDEVNGGVSFTTDSFSPYAVSYIEYEVSTLAELRSAVGIDNAYIKLTADITAVFDGTDTDDRDEYHSWNYTSQPTSSVYSSNPAHRAYFAVLIRGKNIALDLNGHTLESVEHYEDGNTYCHGTICLNRKSSLNITDTAGGGIVKVNGVHYAVWSHYSEDSYLDIFGGVFMGQSYGGYSYDVNKIGVGALIYGGGIQLDENGTVIGGEHGSINVYSGYFLFENADKRGANGAFNVGNLATERTITIHDGVMLINQRYRETFDENTVFLQDGCELEKVTLSEPVVINGVSYDTWYRVVTEAPEFKSVFENTETYLYRVGNSNAVKLGSLFRMTSTALTDSAAIDLTVTTVSGNATGTYTAASSVTDWANGTIKFAGTGVAKITINGCELLVEVVAGKNITAASELSGGTNNILLNDITISSGGSFTLTNSSLWGNGFTFDIRGASHAANKQGVIVLNNATLDNVKVIGDTFTTYGKLFSDEYYLSAVAAVGGNCVISNSYISGCHSAVRVSGATLLVDNATLYGGRLSNMEITTGNVTLRDVITANEVTDVDGTKVLGFGVFVYDYATNVKINIEGTLTQYNWACEADKSYLPNNTNVSAGADFAFGSKCTAFQKTYDGTKYVNFGILNISSNVSVSDISGIPSDYASVAYSSSFVATVKADSTTATEMFANGVPDYDETAYAPTEQGAVKPTFTWTYPSSYNEADGTITLSFEKGKSTTLDPNFLAAVKNGYTLSVKVAMDGTDYTGKTITFSDSGEHTLTYTVTDPYQYGADGAASGEITYTFAIPVLTVATEPDVKHAEFSYTDGNSVKIVEINGKKYVMPDVSATGSTIASTTVNGTTIYMPVVAAIYKNNSSDFNIYSPIFTAINITDYIGNSATTYNKSSTAMPGAFGYTGSGNTAPYYYGGANQGDPAVYSSYGLCYNSLKGADITAKTQTVEFYYTDNAGQTYYYYIQYSFAAHTCPGSSGCVTPDTMITLADGTQKRVDSLTGDELLLVWNMETGKLDSAPIMFVDRDAETLINVVYLTFSDGTVVKVITEHGFWDYDLNRYVYLDENAAAYIGHTFAKQDGDGLSKVKLVDVTVKQEYSSAYSPVTAGHLCYFVNGMLSMPGGVGGLFNIFDVDPDTMTYDFASIEMDVETYGLFTYEELNAIVPLSREMFESAGGKYLKISIGKGNMTLEELVAMIERYSEYFI